MGRKQGTIFFGQVGGNSSLVKSRGKDLINKESEIKEMLGDKQ